MPGFRHRRLGLVGCKFLCGSLMTRSFACCIVVGLVGASVAAGQGPPYSPLSTSPQSQPPARPFPGQPAPSSMDVPLRLIAEARESYRGVTDYTALFVKRERLRGQLQPENLIALKVRTQPFSVYMRWLRPQNLIGQEACYVAGRNNGQMRVHSTGFLGAVGFVSLDPHDPRVMENSRHDITEAGIGNLIERFGNRWEAESRLNKTVVRIAEYDYDKRRCTRVETLHPDNSGRHFTFYRSIIYFDKQTHLPVRVENYDWPQADANGVLSESYSYADLKLNVGLTDASFNR